MDRLIWKILFLVLFLGLPTQVLAENDQQNAPLDAKQHYIDGKIHFAEERFDEALASFTESYNLSGEPNLLFNLALTHEQLNDNQRAIAFYELYVEEVPDAPDLGDVKTQIEALKAKIAASSPPPSAPPLDVPLSEKDPLTYYETDIKEKDGKERPGVFWPGVVVGAGGLLIASGVVTAILAQKEYDSLKNGCSPNCSDSDIKKAKGLAMATDFTFAFGGAAVVAGVVLWIVKKKNKKDEKKQPVAVNPSVSVLFGGGGLIVEGQF